MEDKGATISGHRQVALCMSTLASVAEEEAGLLPPPSKSVTSLVLPKRAFHNHILYLSSCKTFYYWL